MHDPNPSVRMEELSEAVAAKSPAPSVMTAPIAGTETERNKPGCGPFKLDCGLFKLGCGALKPGC